MLYSCFVFILAVVNSAFSQPIGNEERHRVVIVGAGVSGFAAAATLMSANFSDFVVLEASDRVGGRIHTVQFGGVAIEKGAEYVHGEKGNAVFELASPLDLLVSYASLQPNSQYLYYDVSGHMYNSSLVITVLEQAWDILKNDSGGFNGSVADYFYPKLEEILTTHSVDPGLGQAIRHLLTLFMGQDNACDNLEQLGTLGTSRYVINEGNQEWKWKRGTKGYKTIFDILSKKFSNDSEGLSVMDKILFGKEVQLVDRDEGSGEVVLKCADGNSYRAEHVIVTVSLGVLKEHAEDMFRPALPHEKTGAIQNLGMGCVDKVFFLFPTKWWPSDLNSITALFSQNHLDDFRKNSTHGYWTSNVAGFDAVMDHDRMLCMWLTGQTCRTAEKLTDEQVIDGLLELLNALVGQNFLIPRPEAILRSNWGSYKYTLGSYSFHTVDSDRLNVTRRQLSQPLLHGEKPVVMFAGEATDEINFSTVHGALSSGRREANRLLQYTQSHS